MFSAGPVKRTRDFVSSELLPALESCDSLATDLSALDSASDLTNTSLLPSSLLDTFPPLKKFCREDDSTSAVSDDLHFSAAEFELHTTPSRPNCRVGLGTQSCSPPLSSCSSSPGSPRSVVSEFKPAPPTPSAQPVSVKARPVPTAPVGAAVNPSPVTAAFQMQCASTERTNMAGVQFPLLTPTGSDGSAWKPLILMTDEELHARIAAVNSEDDEEEKRDPNDPDAHVRIWNRRERRKIAGNAAPLRRNVPSYLSSHPDCEVYNYQDKPVGWKPKKKNAKRKRVVNVLLMEVQRRSDLEAQRQASAYSAYAEQQRKSVNGGDKGSNFECETCPDGSDTADVNGRSVMRSRKYCGSYRCRMRRFGIDGKLDPSLKGSVAVPLEVPSEFDLAESTMSAATDVQAGLGFAGEELSAILFDKDDLEVSSLPTLPGKFGDIPDEH